MHYKQRVVILINSKQNEDKVNYPYIYGNNNTWMTYEENFNNLIKTGTYIGEYEIINTCMEFKCNIVIYKLEIDNKGELIYKFETIRSNIANFNPFIPIILIAWINNNHYELLLPNGLNEEEIPIEYNLLIANLKSSLDENKSQSNTNKKNSDNHGNSNCQKDSKIEFIRVKENNSKNKIDKFERKQPIKYQ